MKCFYHPAADAVGLCKHCSRGICHDCVAEVEGGLACRGKHEQKVESVTRLVERNIRVTSRGSQTLLALVVYWGSAAVCFYLLLTIPVTYLQIMLGVMTAVMLLCGIGPAQVLLSRGTKSGQEKERR